MDTNTEIKELYQELLPASLFKSRKANVMAFKHTLRYLAYNKYNLTYEQITNLEKELYGYATDRSTLINSVNNFKHFSSDYDYQQILIYLNQRSTPTDFGLAQE